MARQIIAFDALIPSGTAPDDGFSTDMSFPPRVVTQVEILIPPGANGQVGIQLANSGTQIIPYNAGAYLVDSGRRIVWPLDGYIDSGSWQLLGYNTGNFDHTVYVTFLLDLVQNDTEALQPAVDLSALSTAPTQADTQAAADQAAADALAAALAATGSQ